MSDIRLDDNWDLKLESGDLSLTGGAIAAKQNLIQRLRTFLGEWFLDRRRGVPYFEQVLVKKPNPLIAANALKSVIINTPGVLELTSFSFNVDGATREATLRFSARTTDGSITFDEVIP